MNVKLVAAVTTIHQGKATMRWFAMLILTLLGTTSAQALRVQDGYVRGMLPGQPNTAAFMLFVNDTAAPLAIVGASSPVAARVEIHQHLYEAGMMRMRHVESITIAAGKAVRFAPGGYHLMLLDLQRPLAEGDLVAIVLELGNGDRQTVELAVTSVLNERQQLQEEET